MAQTYTPEGMSETERCNELYPRFIELIVMVLTTSPLISTIITSARLHDSTNWNAIAISFVAGFGEMDTFLLEVALESSSMTLVDLRSGKVESK